jgi:hypothetical protein
MNKMKAIFHYLKLFISVSALMVVAAFLAALLSICADKVFNISLNAEKQKLSAVELLTFISNPLPIKSKWIYYKDDSMYILELEHGWLVRDNIVSPMSSPVFVPKPTADN